MTVARTAVPETPASNASATAAMATDAARREPAAPIAESVPRARAEPGLCGRTRATAFRTDMPPLYAIPTKAGAKPPVGDRMVMVCDPPLLGGGFPASPAGRTAPRTPPRTGRGRDTQGFAALFTSASWDNTLPRL